MKRCIFCGAEIVENAKFCSACGKEQAIFFHQVFRRNGISETDFIQKINDWFATYSQVADVSCQFGTDTSIGLLANTRLLNALSIKYRCLEGRNQYQYGLVKLEHIGLMPKKADAILNQWKKNNPGAIVVGCQHSLNQRGDASSLLLGGIMAVNRHNLYVLFKFDRRYGTAAPVNKP